MSTQVQGSYDQVPSSSKYRTSGSIPFDVHNRLFENLFTRRGVQDKIVTRIIHAIDIRTQADPNFIAGKSIDNETHLNDLLNDLHTHLNPQQSIT